MSSDLRHCQTLAVALLGIATGAVGFGLFGAEFRVSSELLPTAKLVVGGYALVSYVFLIASVRDILGLDDTTDAEVVKQPLGDMFAVVLFVISVFVIGIFDKPADNQPSATRSPSLEEEGADATWRRSIRLDLVPVRDLDASPEHRGG